MEFSDRYIDSGGAFGFYDNFPSVEASVGSFSVTSGTISGLANTLAINAPRVHRTAGTVFFRGTVSKIFADTPARICNAVATLGTPPMLGREMSMAREHFADRHPTHERQHLRMSPPRRR